MPYLPDTAVDVLRALHVEQAALRAELRAMRRAIEVLAGGAAPDAAAALTATVYAVAADRIFRSWELIDMSHRPGVPEQALRELLGDRNPVAVGKLLATAADKLCPDTGLMLVRVGEKPDRLSNMWRVLPTRTYANR